MSTATQRTPFWRDVRILRVVFQIAVVVAVGAFLIYIYDNLTANLRQQGIPTSFSFLDQPAGFRIADTDFSPANSVLNAFIAGFRNTIIVALAGCVLTLVLGTIIGIGRLSANWLVAKAAAVYVETFRNLPPLLVIIFVNTAFLVTFPAIDDASPIGGLLVLSVGDNAVASLRDGGNAGAYVIIVVLALVTGVAVRSWLGRREDRLGRPQHKSLAALALVTAVGVVGYVTLGAPVLLSHPEIEGFQINGGFSMGLPFVSVLVALVLYTASHVAEIVRGSILAVPKGQTEAARSIGLSPAQRLRYVVLPQAFRIATPPTINQFLNLTKNTSLGISVGYAEAMFVTRTTIGNGQPAVQSIVVVMGFYLVLSLAISLVSNVANRRLQLVER